MWRSGISGPKWPLGHGLSNYELKPVPSRIRLVSNVNLHPRQGSSSFKFGRIASSSVTSSSGEDGENISEEHASSLFSLYAGRCAISNSITSVITWLIHAPWRLLIWLLICSTAMVMNIVNVAVKCWFSRASCERYKARARREINLKSLNTGVANSCYIIAWCMNSIRANVKFWKVETNNDCAGYSINYPPLYIIT